MPNESVELRVALLPVAFVVEPGERLRLEITNADSTELDQPMTHWYGQKVGTDTYRHDLRAASQQHVGEELGGRGERQFRAPDQHDVPRAPITGGEST